MHLASLFMSQKLHQCNFIQILSMLHHHRTIQKGNLLWFLEQKFRDEIFSKIRDIIKCLIIKVVLSFTDIYQCVVVVFSCEGRQTAQPVNGRNQEKLNPRRRVYNWKFDYSCNLLCRFKNKHYFRFLHFISMNKTML